MTSLEAGIVPGVPCGAIIGVALCRAHGTLATVGGAVAGLVAGAVAGMLLAWSYMLLAFVLLLLWRASQKRADGSPEETDVEVLDHVLRFPIFGGVIISTVFWFEPGWQYALVAVLILAFGFGLVGAVCCETVKDSPFIQGAIGLRINDRNAQPSDGSDAPTPSEDDGRETE